MKPYLERIAPVWKPHKGQREFLLHRARTKVLACGRRWGKTDACAAQVVFGMCGPPTRTLLVAPTLDQARILFERVRALVSRILEMGLGLWRDGPRLVERHAPYPRLRLEDHEVVARSGHLPRALRGHESDHIVVDEAAYVSDGLIEQALWPMLATTDGTMTLLSTPRGFNGFWRMFRLGQLPKSGVWSRTGPSSENPRVSKRFLAAQRELVSERTFAVEYEAKFLDDEGAVFREEALNACLEPILEVPRGAVRIGVDFARYRDFTVVAVLVGCRERATLVELDRFQRGSWGAQIERVAAIARRYPDARLVCDGTGVGDPLVELLRRALPRHSVRDFLFTASSKPDLLERLVALVEQHALRIPADPVLLREMRAFRWSGGRLDGGAEHDDTVIALALAAYDLPREHRIAVRLGDSRRFL